MRPLYNNLKIVLEAAGFNVAPYGENTFDDGSRSVVIEILETNVIEPGFNIFESTFNVSLINDAQWEENCALINDAIHSFIPMGERIYEEELSIADNSEMMEILELPAITSLNTEVDPDTGEEIQTSTFQIKYCY